MQWKQQVTGKEKWLTVKTAILPTCDTTLTGVVD